MRRILQFIALKATLVFCFVGATEPQTEKIHPFPVDVSVFDGQGSLLIHWTYPESILANQFRIFVHESGEVDFKLLSELPPHQTFYLDYMCEKDVRYFYKIELEDTFGNIFTSDTLTPAFGTCLLIEDSTAYDSTIVSVQDLILAKILAKANEIDPYQVYDPILDLINLNKPINSIWFENYPIEKLKSAEPIFQILETCILDPMLMEEILAEETLYRNLFLISPETWLTNVEKMLLDVQIYWEQLMTEYPKALERFETTAPIRMIGYRITEEDQKELMLHIFHPEQITSSEIFLLSGDEYVNLGEYLIENNSRFTVILPEQWQMVDLMMDDIFIQSSPLIFNESICFTLDGDFIPVEELNLKVGRPESTLWMNELTWNPYSKTIQLEVAGNPEFEDQYSILIQDEPLWEVESNPGFEVQYQDSTLALQEEFEYPIIISFKKMVKEELVTIEHLVLDSLPVAISRMPDGGPWHYAESTTLGISNEPVRESFETDLLPELFVLYQNYPNPFNGMTRITFDLLEDAIVSLYITDATGRIHDKFMEGEFTTSGTYHYNWNGEGRSTGIYFFTIHAQVDNRPPTTFSRKMIYLK